MMKIIQYSKDNIKAVVIAKDVDDGYYRLNLYAPKEDWSKAESFTICYPRNSLTPRVLAVEGGLDTIREAHRILGRVVPADQNDMIRWAVKSKDSVYTNAGVAFRILGEVL